jgi:hypothetical protein
MATRIFQRGNFIVCIKASIENIIPINNFDYQTVTVDTIRFKDVVENVSVDELIADVQNEAGVLIGDYTALVAYLGAFAPAVAGGGGGGGDATAANQTTQITEAQTANTNLSNLLAELQLKADLTETQPVSLASLPLATNAATEAKQDNIITQLTGVQRTPTLTRVTNATGSPIASGAVEVSVYNAGNSDGVLLGATIKKGETITFKVNNQKDTLGAISYDGTGTELVIQTLV